MKMLVGSDANNHEFRRQILFPCYTVGKLPVSDSYTRMSVVYYMPSARVSC